ncbi:MAG: DUF4157 domain-containing protein [Anaerolineales bacterium]|nr:DUF4157 domain-containing protein [Anaerolineales bacterium]
MPFKWRWPFRWPRRKTEPQAEDAAPPAPPTPGIPVEAGHAAAPGATKHLTPPGASLALAGGPASLPVTSSGDPELAGAGLEQELLARLAGRAVPPMLGQLGGLPAMAQTLPTVEHFMQQLSVAPVQRLLEGALPMPADFNALLSALSSFGGAPARLSEAVFAEQLAPSVGLTDVLPPLGSLPGQTPAISGQAPVLTPARETAPGGPLTAAPLSVAEPEAGQPPRSATRPPEPGRGEAAQRLVGSPAPPVLAAWLPAEPPGPLTHVLPPALTLTANILPEAEFKPTQRALAPYAPAWSAPGDFAAPGTPAGERITPAQRTSIESQRGQGQPLQPELREHFETAYGASLGNVRVHTGQGAHSTAESLNAIAFASGHDVFFTQNAFRPDTLPGLGLIGHELAHIVQQQSGLPGDSQALRPADDAFERRADQLAAAALQLPAPALPGAQAASGAPVQRVILGELRQPPEPAPAVLNRAAALEAGQRPLSTGAVGADTPEPVQRFGLGDLGSLARNVPAELPSLPASLPHSLPSLDEAAERVSGLTAELPNPTEMLSSLRDLPELGGLRNLGGLGGLGGLSSLSDLSSLRGLSENLPSLGSLGERLSGAAGSLAGQLSGALPSLGELPGGLGRLAGNLPAGLPGLAELPGGLPSLGSAAQSLAGQLPGLPELPGIGAMPDLGELPTLSGLQPPDMPLTGALGGLSQSLGGVGQGAQEALGSITSLAPSAPEMPAAPPLPSLEKLTEHIWKQVQHRLKVERERSRGLA